MTSRILLSPPDVGPAERAALLRAFDSGWVAPLGPEVDAFEAELAQTCARQYAVALSSGTAALHLALQTLGVRPGDEVLVATLTFVATANAVAYCGARPVFIDSDASTWTIDPTLLAQELHRLATVGRRPAAVIAVDIFGRCADYRAIEKICADFEVPVIEDAAEALGATDGGEPAGSFGHSAVVSFNGNKIMTTSGGGALLTDDEQQAQRVAHLATQAREPAPHYEHHEVGYNYRLSNLLAALGRAQLARLRQLVDRRRQLRARYRDQLGHLPGISFAPDPDGESNAWLTVLTVDAARPGTSRDDVLDALAAQDIEARPVWKPMHRQAAYASCRTVGGDVSDRLFATGVCLPSGSGLSDEEQQRVIDVLTTALTARTAA